MTIARRQAHIGRWTSHAPALLFVCSAYYLTLVYARGDWPEFIAISTIPMLTASGIAVLRAERLTLWPSLVLALSVLVFFGSHDITILWGSTALIVLAGAVCAAVPSVRSQITRSGLTRLAIVVIPATLVNAWYLLPAVAYQSYTHIAHETGYTTVMRNLAPLVSFAHLFTFSRASVVGNTPAFALALPVALIAGVLFAIFVSLRHSGDSAWRRALWLFAAADFAFGIMMTHPGLVLALPAPFTFIQFTYRLESYVLMLLSGALICALALARHWPRIWRLRFWATLPPVALIAVVGAGQQVAAYPRGPTRSVAVVPDRYTVFAPAGQPPSPQPGALYDYMDMSLPLIDVPPATHIEFPASAANDGMVSIPVSLPQGTLVDTNLAGAPYLVHVTGARVVGRDPSGHMVMRVFGATHHIDQQISLAPAAGGDVALGRLIAMFAATALVLTLVGVLVRDLVRVRRSPSVRAG